MALGFWLRYFCSLFRLPFIFWLLKLKCGFLGPAVWSWGTCDVWWVLTWEKWDFGASPGVLGVQSMSRHISMREDEEVTLRFGKLWGWYIGIWGKGWDLFPSIVKLVSGYYHLGLLFLLQKGPSHWADLDQRRSQTWTWGGASPSFIHLLTHSFLYHPILSIQEPIHPTYAQELELGTFDIENKATVPPSHSIGETVDIDRCDYST